MQTFNVEFNEEGKWYWKDQTHHMKVGENFQAEIFVPLACKGEFDFASAPPGAQCWRHQTLVRVSDGKVLFNKRGAMPGADNVKLDQPGQYNWTCDFDNGQGGLYEAPDADGTSTIAVSLKKS